MAKSEDIDPQEYLQKDPVGVDAERRFEDFQRRDHVVAAAGRMPRPAISLRKTRRPRFMNSKRSFQKTCNRLGAALPGQAWPGREPNTASNAP
jgi:hypothetical protein